MRTIKKYKLMAILRDEKSARSAWGRGVQAYAAEIVGGLGSDILLDDITKDFDKAIEDSYGGCYLIYDEDIAMRLCCPSELKRVKYGEKQPNSRESWLTMQARAIYQARLHVRKLIYMFGGE